MGMPILPRELDDHDMSKEELVELWTSLVREIMDPEYSNRTHGSRRTYEAGCRGPMCRKGMRDHGRRRNSAQMSSKFQYIDPIVEYWRPIAEMMVVAAFDELMEKLTAAS